MASEDLPNSSHSIVAPLFDLAEYDRAFARFVGKAIDELTTRKSPVLSRIKTVPASSISTTRNTTPSGEVVENSPVMIESHFRVDFGDAVAGRLATITVSIDIAAEERLEAIAPQFFDYFTRLCQAAGTASDAKGAPLSHELITKSLENVEFDFDEDGEPDLEPLIHPSSDLRKAISLLDVIKGLPPRTEEETQAWNAMIDRKRKKFNDRRRRRQLS